MREFTINKYCHLLKFISNNTSYAFVTLQSYFNNKNRDRFLILRHDIDRIPLNALEMAKAESNLGIKATYYFRIRPDIFNEDIITQIAKLGHDIGYHYETMDTSQGDIDKAYEEFAKNLIKFRTIFPVTSVCMHGSPLSKWDNKDIWKKYSYRELKIIGEPYLDINYNEVFYLTDAGRIWNNQKSNVRDKVETSFNFEIHKIEDFIALLEGNCLPDQILLNLHPHLWTDNMAQWYSTLLLQRVKNIAKTILIKIRK